MIADGATHFVHKDKEPIYLFNLIPHHVHIQKGPQIKRWKNYYKPRQQKRDELLEMYNGQPHKKN
jgi:hypothetical protein